MATYFQGNIRGILLSVLLALLQSLCAWEAAASEAEASVYCFKQGRVEHLLSAISPYAPEKPVENGFTLEGIRIDKSQIHFVLTKNGKEARMTLRPEEQAVGEFHFLYEKSAPSAAAFQALIAAIEKTSPKLFTKCKRETPKEPTPPKPVHDNRQKALQKVEPQRIIEVTPTSDKEARKPVFHWLLLFGVLLSVGVFIAHKKRARRITNLLLIFLSLTLMLTLTELLFFIPEADDFNIEDIVPNYRISCFPDNPRGYFIPTRFTDQPNVTSFCTFAHEHAWAECKEETKSTHPNHKRILAIGDSFTEAVGVHYEDTWPHRLSILWNEKKPTPPVKVVNCGFQGLGAVMLLKRLEKHIARHEPDMVIYAYVLNDVGVNEFFDEESKWFNPQVPSLVIEQAIIDTVCEGDALGIACFFTSRFALVRDIVKRYWFDTVREKTVTRVSRLYQNPDAEKMRKTLKSIERMAALAKEHDARFFVMIFPFFYQLEADYPFKHAHAFMRQALEKRGIESLDLLSVFQGRKAEALKVHPFDFHPNEIAHRIAAKALFHALQAEKR